MLDLPRRCGRRRARCACWRAPPCAPRRLHAHPPCACENPLASRPPWPSSRASARRAAPGQARSSRAARAPLAAIEVGALQGALRSLAGSCGLRSHDRLLRFLSRSACRCAPPPQLLRTPLVDVAPQVELLRVHAQVPSTKVVGPRLRVARRIAARCSCMASADAKSYACAMLSSDGGSCGLGLGLGPPCACAACRPRSGALS